MSYGVRGVEAATVEGCFFGTLAELVESDGIPWTKTLVGFGSDGTNVMRGKHNSVLSRLLSVLPQLYSLHCTCHVANLCAEAACEAFLPSG